MCQVWLKQADKEQLTGAFIFRNSPLLYLVTVIVVGF